MKIYNIEGNIGAGKTRLWKCLREEARDRGAPLIFLPESAMSVLRGVPWLLKDFYEEPVKYCEELNTRIIKHGCDSLRELLWVPESIVLDSSLLATRIVFVPSAMDQGYLSPDAGQRLIKTIDDFLTTESIEITPIWLPTPPNTCFKQVRHRDRPGEDRITLALLQRHYFLYRKWLGGSEAAIELLGRSSFFGYNLRKLTQIMF